MGVVDARRTVEAVWRIEASRLVARLVRLTGDFGRAEDLAQDALVAALESWPESGVPENPGAWLMATAKRRGIDDLRRRRLAKRKREEVAVGGEGRRRDVVDLDAALDDPIGDEVLRLIFMACHPVLAPAARVALTLRAVAGLRTAEIARAYLVPTATIAQRIVRAKRTLRDAGVAFDLPRGEALAGRLASVLEVIYLVYNEGYAATAGEDWVRPELVAEALRLGRVLAELAPEEGEVHGLVALMELGASRLRARVGPSGEPILLLDQNRSRWDRLLISRGLAALDRAFAASPAPGPYTLQAAIAACHARARTAEETDWERIAALYGALVAVAPSPVVELNRAVAVSMASGPAAGLAIVDRLLDEPRLAGYPLLPAARGDMLARLDRPAEAAAEFRRAAALTRNDRDRAVLLARAAEMKQR